MEELNIKGYTGHFDIMQNPAGDILIIIDALEDEPEKPRLVVDSDRNLLFYRDPTQSLEFKDVGDDVVDIIARVEKVLVAEIRGEQPEREYTVPVRLAHCSINELR